MNEEQDINQLPTGWSRGTLGNVVTKRTIKATPQQYPDVKFIGMDCIEPHTLQPSFLYDFKEFKSSGNFFKKNEVLYGRMRPYLNKVYKAEFEGACSGEFIVLKCKDDFEPNYLKYILHSKSFVRFANDKTSGDRPRISFDEISEYPVLVPPVNYQSHTVSKIEELFSEIDKGIEEIKTAQQQLKVYRQAVLKWAFEGKLTNENIAEGELPKGWKVKPLKEITTVLGDGLHGTPKYSVDGEYYFINGNNLCEGKIEIKGATKRVDLDEYNKHRKELNENSILVSINGTLGNTAFYNNEKVILGKSACYFNVTEEADKYYVRHLIASRKFLNYAIRTATGSTIPNVSLKAMREFQVPLPTIKEQQQIVQEIESRLSVCDKIEETITNSLKQAEALRQSILKKAFEGRLM